MYNVQFIFYANAHNLYGFKGFEDFLSYYPINL